MQKSLKINGSRFAIAFACWLPLGICIGISFMFAGAGVAQFFSDGLYKSISVLKLIGMAAPAFSFIALSIMTLGWLKYRQVHWFWPVVGSIISIPSAIIFSVVFLIYFPALLLAFYLVYYHLRGYKNDLPKLAQQGAAPDPHASASLRRGVG